MTKPVAHIHEMDLKRLAEGRKAEVYPTAVTHERMRPLFAAPVDGRAVEDSTHFMTMVSQYGKAPTQERYDRIYRRYLFDCDRAAVRCGSGQSRKFKIGDRVQKTKGSSWQGRIVGFYSTSLTPVGYAVESEREPGSVQIYPESALAEVGAETFLHHEPGEFGEGAVMRVVRDDG